MRLCMIKLVPQIVEESEYKRGKMNVLNKFAVEVNADGNILFLRYGRCFVSLHRNNNRMISL